MNMSIKFRPIAAGLVAMAVILPVSGAAQRSPDLSGHWVLASATSAGGGRTKEKSERPESSAEVPTRSTTISGAAFNCGTECTIVQKGQMLTVEKAHLASSPALAPTVTLHLDGRQMSVIDSFNPNPRRPIPATARWNGDKIEITSSTGRHTITQLVSIEATQLVVVTSTDFDGDRPLTLRYKRK
jgi:hypothetical protein